jgi:DNA-binding IclR family transcriptional regulator
MKSLHKVLDLIEALGESGYAGIRDLSSATGFPPATIHRMVATLQERGYLKQDPVTKNYSLSLRFLELGSRVQEQFNLISIARPRIEELMAETREGVNLAVRDGDAVVYLDHVPSSYSMVRLFTKAGARVPLYATGVGKAFLSEEDREELDAYLRRTRRKPHTRNTLLDRDRFLAEMEGIRERGYALDNEEMEEGVRCVAALVYDHGGRPAGAISISGTVTRITPDRVDEFGRTVQRCALMISRELGFSSDPALNPHGRKEVEHV